jgi:hypothetical protein
MRCSFCVNKTCDPLLDPPSHIGTIWCDSYFIEASHIRLCARSIERCVFFDSSWCLLVDCFIEGDYPSITIYGNTHNSLQIVKVCANDVF